MGIVRHTYLPVVLPGITRGVARRHQNPGTNQLAPPPPLMRVGNQNMARTGPRQVGPPGPVQENMGNQAPTAGNGRGMGPPSTNFRPKRGCYVCGRYGCHSVQGRIQELSKGGADGERGGSASL